MSPCARALVETIGRAQDRLTDMSPPFAEVDGQLERNMKELARTDSTHPRSLPKDGAPRVAPQGRSPKTHSRIQVMIRDDKKSHRRPDPAARIVPSRASDQAVRYQALHGCMHAYEALAPASPLPNMRSCIGFKSGCVWPRAAALQHASARQKTWVKTNAIGEVAATA